MKCSTLKQFTQTVILGLGLFAGGFFSGLGAATIPCTPANFLSLVANATPGDIFVLAPGAYPTFNGCPAGTASAPVRIQGQSGVKFAHIGFYGSQFSYVVLDSILVDGDQMIFGNGAHHLTLQNSEVRNIRGQAGGFEMYGVNDCASLNNYIHDVGTRANYDHGIYMYGLRNRIEGNRIENVAAYGIHNYSGGKPNGGHSILRNTVRLNGRVPPTQSVFGIVSTSGDGTAIEYNTVDTCIGGIAAGGNVTNIKVNYNTILNITGPWMSLDAAGSGVVANNKVDPGGVIIRSSSISASNNNLSAPGAGGGGSTAPPPATNLDVSQTQSPPADTSQPSGPSTSQVAAPFLIAGVLVAALVLGD